MPIVQSGHYVYTVQTGDTVYSLATRLGSTVEAINEANMLRPPFTDPNLIFPGQILIIPAAALQPLQTIYIIAPGDTLYRIGRRFSADVDMLAGINRLTRPEYISPGHLLWVPAFVYEVVAGDTLNGISVRLGIPLGEILRANEGRPGFSPDVIFPGYRLLLPYPSSVNIVALRPLPGETVRSGVVAAGFARAFEAVILSRIVDDNGTIVSAERPIMTSEGGPAYGSFSQAIAFDRQPTARSGVLWLYTRSAKDGSIRDLIQVRIYFA